MLGVLAIEAVFMVIVVLCVILAAHTHEKRSMIVGILCIIFGTAMYASPLTIMVRIRRTPNSLIHALFPRSVCCSGGAVYLFGTLSACGTWLINLYGLDVRWD